MLVHNELKDAVILIFANKADMPTARDPDELTEIYGFNEIQDHEWKVQPCCALTGEGLGEGLDWLSDKLSERVKRGFHNPDDGRGLHVTKMPSNDNRANLTDLSIRTSAFMNTVRSDQAAPQQMIVDDDDIESRGFSSS